MGACVFAASGLDFDVDRYLAGSPFKAMAVFRKGDIAPKNNPERNARLSSGFVVLISDDQEVDLSQQLKEALVFLNRHEAEIKAMWEVGVDDVRLDVGVEMANKMQQAEYLPPELTGALGRLGMGLIFAVAQPPRG
jgi:hypothetical protein